MVCPITQGDHNYHPDSRPPTLFIILTNHLSDSVTLGGAYNEGGASPVDLAAYAIPAAGRVAVQRVELPSANTGYVCI